MMNLKNAEVIATKLRDRLSPFCIKIEILGSIRRKKEQVGDIDILCIPKTEIEQVEVAPSTLFEDAQYKPVSVRSKGFCSILDEMEFITGKSNEAKAMNRKLWLDPGEQEEYNQGFIKVQVFTTTAYSWGYMSIIRTGSDKFNMRMLKRMKDLGYRAQEGNIWWGKRLIEVRTEEELFKKMHMEYVVPENRSI